MMTYMALQVRQPIGEFYLTAIPASTLLKVCFSAPHTRHASDESGMVDDAGHQRKMSKHRLASISQYLQTLEATLPGTIILSANCREDGSCMDPMDGNENLRWRVKKMDGNNGLFQLNIPSEEAVAAVVDGQHRLWGFQGAGDVKENFMIPCAVFLDLPTPQQAAIFATINFNQKPVSKSQTYELFGYNLDEEEESSWSPEKLAVFLTRKLGADPESPFVNHIKVAAIDDRVLSDIARASQKEWTISTATIVECILKMITRNAQRERDELHKYPIEKRTRSLLRDLDVDPRYNHVKPVFRDYYLSGDQDIVIYKAIINFFTVVKDVFWKDGLHTPLKKTAGIQALFLIMTEILRKDLLERQDFRRESFAKILSRASELDFNNQFFQESSGKGRSLIVEAFLVALRYKSAREVDNKGLREYLNSVLKD